MPTYTVRWSSTSVYQAEVEADTEGDAQDDSTLAELETGENWLETPERDVLEIREGDE